ncbi:hypothetical protein DPMN_150354 [Dreissena polymorpha]|uniref:Folylpolyglutamate synthase n=3 Tax=Dreissena polymorpha TaxID=45954 RepID=A0A9D4FGA3_DREPO|nr:hypothetical protein DPMN_150354 [Dreissena polymorpha]
MVRTLISSAIKGAECSKYEDAVKMLNTLQTNAQTIEKIRQERDKNAHLNIPRMLNYASRVGIQESDMSRLNVIHISGTKGKGSTCAYCESILRHHGYKTGFYSSPHLVEVRERLNVGGQPIESEKFASYFWEVYHKLDSTKDAGDGTMPNYFGFLTVMSLYVFLQEKVDVAIMEVGIGGEYDCTNMIRNPVVCGVTSLGLDHVSILGSTIDKIAWHKAGIFKPGVPAFTVPQPPEAMRVLAERALEKGTVLHQCQDLGAYNRILKLGIKGSVQTLNAALALQLCHTWMMKYKERCITNESRPQEQSDMSLVPESTASITASASQMDIPTVSPITLTQNDIKGLEECVWLGRNQVINVSGVCFYLDGAHTVESIQQCVEWFKTETEAEKSNYRDGVYRILLYNCTGDRDSFTLMKPLVSCGFDAALFCPNLAYEIALSADQTNNTVTKESQCKRCVTNKETFDDLLQQQQNIGGSNNLEMGTTGNKAECQSLIFSSISECINWICKRKWEENRVVSEKLRKGDLLNNSKVSINRDWTDEPVMNGTCISDTKVTNKVESGQGLQNSDEGVYKYSNHASGDADRRHVEVLITGSLHLVGGALRVLWDRQLE